MHTHISRHWKIFVDDFGHTLKSKFFLFFPSHSHAHPNLSSLTIFSLLGNFWGAKLKRAMQQRKIPDSGFGQGLQSCTSAPPPGRSELAWRHPAFFSEWEHLAFLSLSLCIRTRIPKQGLSICLLQWKHRVLTTGLPGKSHLFFYGAILRIYLSIYLIIKFQLHWDTVMTKRCVKTSPNI